MKGPLAAVVLTTLAGTGGPEPDREVLPPRVRTIVVHVLGGPSYKDPSRRFLFFTPAETHALWSRRFGAHWIIWTDGTLWPRHVREGEAASWAPAAQRATAAETRRLAWEAAPVYGHVRGANSRSVGIELAHSGRRKDPLPKVQVRSLAWLLRALIDMAGGRMALADIVGHKDLDRRPAYVEPRCERPGCPVFVDEAGRPYRRRVDPPETVFERLRREGLAIPRPPDGDQELARAERLDPGARPAVLPDQADDPTAGTIRGRH